MNVKELREKLAAFTRAGTRDDDEVKIVVKHERGQPYSYEVVQVDVTLEHDKAVVKLHGGQYIIG